MPLATDFKARINGVVPSYSDIQFTIAGQIENGIVAISWDTEREKENYYAAGSEPIGVAYGQRKYSASITFTKQTYDSIIKVSPNNRIEDLPPFDLPVVLINETGSFVRTTLKNFEITKASQDYKKGDKGLEVKCDAIISGIVTTFS